MVSKKVLAAAAIGTIITIIIFGLSPPVTLQYQLLENTDQCFTDCSLKFRFKINRDRTIWLPDDVGTEFVKARYAEDLKDWGLRILEPVTYNVTIPDTTCYPYNTTQPGNDTNVTIVTIQNCTTTYIQEERTEDQWVDWDPFGKTIKKNKWYYVELWGKKQVKLGPNNIDARPTIFGRELPFAWWNSDYGYRTPIIANSTALQTISVNDTYGINDTIVWTYQSNESFVYSTASGLGGTIAVANETDEKFWEFDNNYTGNSPTSVWSSSSAPAVWHFNGATSVAYDSSGKGHNATKLDVVISQNETGKFNKASGFPGTKQGWTVGTSGDFNVSADGFTVTMWIYPNGTEGSDEWILERWDNSADNQFIFLSETAATNDGWKFQISADGSTTSGVCTSGAIPFNQWYHLAFGWNSTHGLVYQNSILNCTFVQAGVFNATRNMTIGDIGLVAGDHNAHFNGLIDEIRWYNTSLTLAQIQREYWIGINNYTIFGAEEEYTPVDTCTPGVNWLMDCSDNCTKTTAISTGNWTIYGSGGYFLCDACNLTVESMAMNATSCEVLFNGTFKYVVGD